MGASLSSGNVAKDDWSRKGTHDGVPIDKRRPSLQVRMPISGRRPMHRRKQHGIVKASLETLSVADVHKLLHARFDQLQCFAHGDALCRRLSEQLHRIPGAANMLLRIGQDILSDFPPELFLFIVAILAGPLDWSDTFRQILNLAQASKLTLRRILRNFSSLKSKLSVTFNEETLLRFMEAVEEESAMDVEGRISAEEVRCMVIGQARFAFSDVHRDDVQFRKRISVFLACMDTVRANDRRIPSYETAFRFTTGKLNAKANSKENMKTIVVGQGVLAELAREGYMQRMTRLEFVGFDFIDADSTAGWLKASLVAQITNLIVRNSFWKNSMNVESLGTFANGDDFQLFNEDFAFEAGSRREPRSRFGMNFGDGVAATFFHMPQLRILELTSDMLVPQISSALTRLALSDEDFKAFHQGTPFRQDSPFLQDSVMQSSGLHELRKLIVRTPNTWRSDEDQSWIRVVHVLKQQQRENPPHRGFEGIDAMNIRVALEALEFTQAFVDHQGFVHASVNDGFGKLTHFELEHANLHVDNAFQIMLPIPQFHTLALRAMLVTDGFFDLTSGIRRWALRHLELEGIPFHILKRMRGAAFKLATPIVKGRVHITHTFEGILATHFTDLIDGAYFPQEADYVSKKRTARETKIVKATYLTEDAFRTLLPLKEGDGNEHMLQVLRLAFQPLLRMHELTAIFDGQWRNMHTLRIAFVGHTFHTPARVTLKNRRTEVDQQLQNLINEGTRQGWPLGYLWEPFGYALQSVSRLGSVLAPFVGTMKDREVAAFSLSTLRKLHLEYINAQHMRKPAFQVITLAGMNAEMKILLGELQWAKPSLVRDHLRLSSETATSVAEGNRERMDRLVTSVATLSPLQQRLLAMGHLNWLTEQAIDDNLPLSFDEDAVKELLVRTTGTLSLALKQFMHPHISRNLVELTLQTVTLTPGVFLPLLIEDVGRQPLPLQKLEKLVLGGDIGHNVTLLHYLDIYALFVGTGGLPSVTHLTFQEIATQSEHKDSIDSLIFTPEHGILPKLEHLVVSQPKWLEQLASLEINQGKDLFTITKTLQAIVRRNRPPESAMVVDLAPSVIVV